MSTPETDPVGTVREGAGPGLVLVKLSHAFWSEVGGPRSGCHTFPSSALLAGDHPVIGMVPGLPPVVSIADHLVAAAATAGDRFAGRTA